MYKHDKNDSPTLTTLKSLHNASTIAIWVIAAWCALFAVSAIASYFVG